MSPTAAKRSARRVLQGWRSEGVSVEATKSRVILNGVEGEVKDLIEKTAEKRNKTLKAARDREILHFV